MSEDKERDRMGDHAKRRFGRRWLLLVGTVLAAIFFCLAWKAGWWDFRSVDERLAEIDAELAIPDSENAAVYCRRFLTDPDNAAVLDGLSGFSPSAYVEPWVDSEHPELAAELKKQQVFVQELLEISQMQKARFPVCPGPSDGSWQMLPDMRRLTFVLSWAAANDLAEGRIDAAYGKYRCQLRLARHLQQQPATYYSSVGIAIEAVASGNIRRAVMRDGITPGQLRSLEVILEEPWNLNHVDAEITARVDRLVEEKERSQLPFATRFKQWLLDRRGRRQHEQRRRLILLRLEAIRRATPILIAIRRHKTRDGRWPETLGQIEPELSTQVLIDPQNNGPFVYKRQGSSIVFYSKGPNGIDEDGSSSRPADDWPIWPLKIETVPPAGR
jgi:hypothetical protein